MSAMSKSARLQTAVDNVRTTSTIKAILVYDLYLFIFHKRELQPCDGIRHSELLLKRLELAEL